MDDEKTFLRAEYEALRGEIEVVSKELRDTEKYAILVNAAIWTWLATEGSDMPETLRLCMWWLPVAIAVLGFARFLGAKKTLLMMAEYIRESIEPQFLGKDRGWEAFLEASPSANRRWWISSYLIWGALFTISVFFALYMLVSANQIYEAQTIPRAVTS